MRRRAVSAVLALSLALACKAREDPAPPDPASAASTVSTASTVSARPAGRIRLVTAPRDGDVAAIVRDEAAKAARDRRRLLVYVGATWCEPCQRFHEAAQRGELDARFGDLTLLEFDSDRDGERLMSAGYGSQYIPLFALPAADGTASGKQIEGAIKGEGAVAFVVPRLASLLGP